MRRISFSSMRRRLRTRRRSRRRRQGKVFFFEKKKQKTFVDLGPCTKAGPLCSVPITKSFLLLFFKKEGLPISNHRRSRRMSSGNLTIDLPERFHPGGLVGRPLAGVRVVRFGFGRLSRRVPSGLSCFLLGVEVVRRALGPSGRWHRVIGSCAKEGIEIPMKIRIRLGGGRRPVETLARQQVLVLLQITQRRVFRQLRRQG